MPDTPVGIDPNRSSAARVYDYLLGGKDNYEVDREVAAQLADAAPGVPLIARDNRAWLGRIVRYLAGSLGIDQFLDLGSGLPTVDNTHQIAARANRNVRVVYVDYDPVVAAHGKVLLDDQASSSFVEADLTQPDEVVHHETVVKDLDFERPIAVLVLATLHNISEEHDQQQIMRAYIDALPSGSYVAISQIADPADGSPLSQKAKDLSAAGLGSAMGTGQLRTHREVVDTFHGLELIEPGLVPPAEWWPDGPLATPLQDVQRLVVGAVGRKP